MLIQKLKAKSRKLKASSGYTLIELLVVMAMIGILSTVVLASLNGSRERARDVIRAGDLKSLSQSLETYFSENFVFPEALDDGNAESGDDLKQYYSNRIIPRDNYQDRAYDYIATENPTGYCLGAKMEQETAENDVECGLGEVPGVNYQLQGP